MRLSARLLVSILLCASSAMAKTGALLPPTGPQSVGRVIFHWKDDSRPEVHSSNKNDKREVGVWIWYPTSASSGKTAPYIDNLFELRPALSSDGIATARDTRTHAVPGAPLSMMPDRLPVLILSPGAGGTPALYTSFCEDLASHGYIVAAIDHPYDDVAFQLSNGRVVKETKEPSGGEELLRYQRERVRVRVEDVRFVLNKLAQIQDGKLTSPFRGRLDLSRIGVFGHSRGGMTAAEACVKDERVKACANFDGVVYAMPAYDDSGHGPLQPFLFIEKPLPAMKGEKPEDTKGRFAFLRERGNALLSGVQSGRSYRITIDGATHATFSDEEILSNDGAPRPRQLLEFARTYLREFFDEALKGKSSSLLAAPPSDAAVQIQVFAPR
jgi:dienelactone hydrolase